MRANQQSSSERTNDDATRTERRRSLGKPGLFLSWRDLWAKLLTLLAVLFLFVVTGADLVTWIMGNG